MEPFNKPPHSDRWLGLTQDAPTGVGRPCVERHRPVLVPSLLGDIRSSASRGYFPGDPVPSTTSSTCLCQYWRGSVAVYGRFWGKTAVKFAASLSHVTPVRTPGDQQPFTTSIWSSHDPRVTEINAA